MCSVPSSMKDRGPVPGTVIVTLLAQEDGDEGSVVTFGTAESSCRLCDYAEYGMGWSQGKMVEGEYASIHLFAPMWKSKVDSDSDAILYGDAICYADNGQVKRATPRVDTATGYAMDDATADGYVLWYRDCCATAHAATA